MKTELTNQVVLFRLANQQRDGKIYFTSALSSIADFDIQMAVLENEDRIVDKARKIDATIRKLIDTPKPEGAKLTWDSPEITEILEKESGLELHTVVITNEQIKAMKPNYDMLYCLLLIKE
jgi:hypothetical protein